MPSPPTPPPEDCSEVERLRFEVAAAQYALKVRDQQLTSQARENAELRRELDTAVPAPQSPQLAADPPPPPSPGLLADPAPAAEPERDAKRGRRKGKRGRADEDAASLLRPADGGEKKPSLVQRMVSVARAAGPAGTKIGRRGVLIGTAAAVLLAVVVVAIVLAVVLTHLGSSSCPARPGCAATPEEYMTRLRVSGGGIVPFDPCVSPSLVGAVVAVPVAPLATDPTTLAPVGKGRRFVAVFGPSVLSQLIPIGRSDVKGLLAAVAGAAPLALTQWSEECPDTESCSYHIVVWQGTCPTSYDACAPQVAWGTLQGFLDCVYGSRSPDVGQAVGMLRAVSFENATGCNATALPLHITNQTQLEAANCSADFVAAAIPLFPAHCTGRNAFSAAYSGQSGCPAEEAFLEASPPTPLALRAYLLLTQGVSVGFSDLGASVNELWVANSLLADLDSGRLETLWNGSAPTPVPTMSPPTPAPTAGPLSEQCKAALGVSAGPEGSGEDCGVRTQNAWGYLNKTCWPNEEPSVERQWCVGVPCVQALDEACPGMAGLGGQCDLCVAEALKTAAECNGSTDVYVKRIYCTNVGCVEALRESNLTAQTPGVCANGMDTSWRKKLSPWCGFDEAHPRALWCMPSQCQLNLEAACPLATHTTISSCQQCVGKVWLDKLNQTCGHGQQTGVQTMYCFPSDCQQELSWYCPGEGGGGASCAACVQKNWNTDLQRRCGGELSTVTDVYCLATTCRESITSACGSVLPPTSPPTPQCAQCVQQHWSAIEPNCDAGETSVTELFCIGNDCSKSLQTACADHPSGPACIQCIADSWPLDSCGTDPMFVAQLFCLPEKCYGSLQAKCPRGNAASCSSLVTASWNGSQGLGQVCSDFDMGDIARLWCLPTVCQDSLQLHCGSAVGGGAKCSECVDGSWSNLTAGCNAYELVVQQLWCTPDHCTSDLLSTSCPLQGKAGSCADCIAPLWKGSLASHCGSDAFVDDTWCASPACIQDLSATCGNVSAYPTTCVDCVHTAWDGVSDACASDEKFAAYVFCLPDQCREAVLKHCRGNRLKGDECSDCVFKHWSEISGKCAAASRNDVLELYCGELPLPSACSTPLVKQGCHQYGEMDCVTCVNQYWSGAVKAGCRETEVEVQRRLCVPGRCAWELNRACPGEKGQNGLEVCRDCVAENWASVSKDCRDQTFIERVWCVPDQCQEALRACINTWDGFKSCGACIENLWPSASVSCGVSELPFVEQSLCVTADCKANLAKTCQASAGRGLGGSCGDCVGQHFDSLQCGADTIWMQQRWCMDPECQTALAGAKGHTACERFTGGNCSGCVQKHWSSLVWSCTSEAYVDQVWCTQVGCQTTLRSTCGSVLTNVTGCLDCVSKNWGALSQYCDDEMEEQRLWCLPRDCQDQLTKCEDPSATVCRACIHSRWGTLQGACPGINESSLQDVWCSTISDGCAGALANTCHGLKAKNAPCADCVSVSWKSLAGSCAGGMDATERQWCMAESCTSDLIDKCGSQLQKGSPCLDCVAGAWSAALDADCGDRSFAQQLWCLPDKCLSGLQAACGSTWQDYAKCSDCVQKTVSGYDSLCHTDLVRLQQLWCLPTQCQADLNQRCSGATGAGAGAACVDCVAANAQYTACGEGNAAAVERLWCLPVSCQESVAAACNTSTSPQQCAGCIRTLFEKGTGGGEVNHTCAVPLGEMQALWCLPAACQEAIAGTDCAAERSQGTLCAQCIQRNWKPLQGGCHDREETAELWCGQMSTACGSELASTDCGAEKGYGRTCRSCVQQRWGADAAIRSACSLSEATVERQWCTPEGCRLALEQSCPRLRGGGMQCSQCVAVHWNSLEPTCVPVAMKKSLDEAYYEQFWCLPDECANAVQRCSQSPAAECVQCIAASWPQISGFCTGVPEAYVSRVWCLSPECQHDLRATCGDSLTPAAGGWEPSTCSNCVTQHWDGLSRSTSCGQDQATVQRAWCLTAECKDGLDAKCTPGKGCPSCVSQAWGNLSSCGDDAVAVERLWCPPTDCQSVLDELCPGQIDGGDMCASCITKAWSSLNASCAGLGLVDMQRLWCIPSGCQAALSTCTASVGGDCIACVDGQWSAVQQQCGGDVQRVFLERLLCLSDDCHTALDQSCAANDTSPGRCAECLVRSRDQLGSCQTTGTLLQQLWCLDSDCQNDLYESPCGHAAGGGLQCAQCVVDWGGYKKHCGDLNTTEALWCGTLAPLCYMAASQACPGMGGQAWACEGCVAGNWSSLAPGSCALSQVAVEQQYCLPAACQLGLAANCSGLIGSGPSCTSCVAQHWHGPSGLEAHCAPAAETDVGALWCISEECSDVLREKCWKARGSGKQCDQCVRSHWQGVSSKCTYPETYVMQWYCTQPACTDLLETVCSGSVDGGVICSSCIEEHWDNLTDACGDLTATQRRWCVQSACETDLASACGPVQLTSDCTDCVHTNWGSLQGSCCAKGKQLCDPPDVARMWCFSEQCQDHVQSASRSCNATAGVQFQGATCAACIDSKWDGMHKPCKDTSRVGVERVWCLPPECDAKLRGACGTLQEHGQACVDCVDDSWGQLAGSCLGDRTTAKRLWCMPAECAANLQQNCSGKDGSECVDCVRASDTAACAMADPTLWELWCISPSCEAQLSASCNSSVLPTCTRCVDERWASSLMAACAPSSAETSARAGEATTQCLWCLESQLSACERALEWSCGGLREQGGACTDCVRASWQTLGLACGEGERELKAMWCLPLGCQEDLKLACGAVERRHGPCEPCVQSGWNNTIKRCGNTTDDLIGAKHLFCGKLSSDCTSALTDSCGDGVVGTGRTCGGCVEAHWDADIAPACDAPKPEAERQWCLPTVCQTALQNYCLGNGTDPAGCLECLDAHWHKQLNPVCGGSNREFVETLWCMPDECVVRTAVCPVGDSAACVDCVDSHWSDIVPACVDLPAVETLRCIAGGCREEFRGVCGGLRAGVASCIGCLRSQWPQVGSVCLAPQAHLERAFCMSDDCGRAVQAACPKGGAAATCASCMAEAWGSLRDVCVGGDEGTVARLWCLAPECEVALDAGCGSAEGAECAACVLHKWSSLEMSCPHTDNATATKLWCRPLPLNCTAALNASCKGSAGQGPQCGDCVSQNWEAVGPHCQSAEALTERDFCVSSACASALDKVCPDVRDSGDTCLRCLDNIQWPLDGCVGDAFYHKRVWCLTTTCRDTLNATCGPPPLSAAATCSQCVSQNWGSALSLVCNAVGIDSVEPLHCLPSTCEQSLRKVCAARSLPYHCAVCVSTNWGQLSADCGDEVRSAQHLWCRTPSDGCLSALDASCPANQTRGPAASCSSCIDGDWQHLSSSCTLAETEAVRGYCGSAACRAAIETNCGAAVAAGGGSSCGNCFAKNWSAQLAPVCPDHEVAFERAWCIPDDCQRLLQTSCPSGPGMPVGECVSCVMASSTIGVCAEGNYAAQAWCLSSGCRSQLDAACPADRGAGQACLECTAKSRATLDVACGTDGVSVDRLWCLPTDCQHSLQTAGCANRSTVGDCNDCIASHWGNSSLDSQCKTDITTLQQLICLPPSCQASTALACSGTSHGGDCMNCLDTYWGGLQGPCGVDEAAVKIDWCLTGSCRMNLTHWGCGRGDGQSCADCIESANRTGKLQAACATPLTAMQQLWCLSDRCQIQLVQSCVADRGGGVGCSACVSARWSTISKECGPQVDQATVEHLWCGALTTTCLTALKASPCAEASGESCSPCVHTNWGTLGSKCSPSSEVTVQQQWCLSADCQTGLSTSRSLAGGGAACIAAVDSRWGSLGKACGSDQAYVEQLWCLPSACQEGLWATCPRPPAGGATPSDCLSCTSAKWPALEPYCGQLSETEVQQLWCLPTACQDSLLSYCPSGKGAGASCIDCVAQQWPSMHTSCSDDQAPVEILWCLPSACQKDRSILCPPGVDGSGPKCASCLQRHWLGLDTPLFSECGATQPEAERLLCLDSSCQSQLTQSPCGPLAGQGVSCSSCIQKNWQHLKGSCGGNDSAFVDEMWCSSLGETCKAALGGLCGAPADTDSQCKRCVTEHWDSISQNCTSGQWHTTRSWCMLTDCPSAVRSKCQGDAAAGPACGQCIQNSWDSLQGNCDNEMEFVEAEMCLPDACQERLLAYCGGGTSLNVSQCAACVESSWDSIAAACKGTGGEVYVTRAWCLPADCRHAAATNCTATIGKVGPCTDCVQQHWRDVQPHCESKAAVDRLWCLADECQAAAEQVCAPHMATTTGCTACIADNWGQLSPSCGGDVVAVERVWCLPVDCQDRLRADCSLGTGGPKTCSACVADSWATLKGLCGTSPATVRHLWCLSEGCETALQDCGSMRGSACGKCLDQHWSESACGADRAVVERMWCLPPVCEEVLQQQCDPNSGSCVDCVEAAWGEEHSSLASACGEGSGREYIERVWCLADSCQDAVRNAVGSPLCQKPSPASSCANCVQIRAQVLHTYCGAESKHLERLACMDSSCSEAFRSLCAGSGAGCADCVFKQWANLSAPCGGDQNRRWVEQTWCLPAGCSDDLLTHCGVAGGGTAECAVCVGMRWGGPAGYAESKSASACSSVDAGVLMREWCLADGCEAALRSSCPSGDGWSQCSSCIESNWPFGGVCGDDAAAVEAAWCVSAQCQNGLTLRCGNRRGSPACGSCVEDNWAGVLQQACPSGGDRTTHRKYLRRVFCNEVSVGCQLVLQDECGGGGGATSCSKCVENHWADLKANCTTGQAAAERSFCVGDPCSQAVTTGCGEYGKGGGCASCVDTYWQGGGGLRSSCSAVDQAYVTKTFCLPSDCEAALGRVAGCTSKPYDECLSCVIKDDWGALRLACGFDPALVQQVFCLPSSSETACLDTVSVQCAGMRGNGAACSVCVKEKWDRLEGACGPRVQPASLARLWCLPTECQRAVSFACPETAAGGRADGGRGCWSCLERNWLPALAVACGPEPYQTAKLWCLPEDCSERLRQSSCAPYEGYGTKCEQCVASVWGGVEAACVQKDTVDALWCTSSLCSSELGKSCGTQRSGLQCAHCIDRSWATFGTYCGSDAGEAELQRRLCLPPSCGDAVRQQCAGSSCRDCVRKCWAPESGTPCGGSATTLAAACGGASAEAVGLLVCASADCHTALLANCERRQGGGTDCGACVDQHWDSVAGSTCSGAEPDVVREYCGPPDCVDAVEGSCGGVRGEGLVCRECVDGHWSLLGPRCDADSGFVMRAWCLDSRCWAAIHTAGCGAKAGGAGCSGCISANWATIAGHCQFTQRDTATMFCGYTPPPPAPLRRNLRATPRA
eukprot:TRINITY_DN2105_c0_g3_i1.p1 TRINITY_DN2105_c0_g3~~TRINITY_DN2105_c0_g3_i1.p1  ORF type:complete len:5418 (+),score=1718.38 TRINITY_DN2105_c0_g3_i1:420-16256(+)